MDPLHEEDPANIAGMTLLGRAWVSGPIVAFLAAGDGAAGSVTSSHVEVLELADPVDPSAGAALDEVARSLALIDDERVAPVVGFEREAARAWLASPVPAGRTLGDLVHGSGALNEAQWQLLARSSLDVLLRLHELEIVHGRVLPDSVWIDDDRIHWSNPGMGYAAWRAGLLHASSWSSGVQGLAPEQLRGLPPSAATDLFSLGCVLAFAGTGRMPWGDARTPTATLVQRIASDPPDTDGMPWHQVRIVAALTAKDPDFRASALADALAQTPGHAVDRAERQSPAAPMDDVVDDVVDGSAAATQPEAPHVVDESLEPAAHAVVESALVMETQDRSRPIGRRRLAVAVLAAAALAVLAIVIVVGRTGSAPAPASSPAVAAEASASPANPAPALALTTKVDYRSDVVPDKEFPGGTEWKFDVCTGDRALISDAVLGRVALYRKTVDGWQRLSARAQVIDPGRCGGDKLNLVIPWSEPRPDAATAGSGWSSCVDYRVIIPETKNFAKTFVDMCVRTKADSA